MQNLTDSRLPCVARPDASAEQPLDAKLVDQKQDVIPPHPHQTTLGCSRAAKTTKERPILLRLHLGH